MYQPKAILVFIPHCNKNLIIKRIRFSSTTIEALMYNYLKNTIRFLLILVEQSGDLCIQIESWKGYTNKNLELVGVCLVFNIICNSRQT